MAILRKNELKIMNETALKEKVLELNKELTKLNAQRAIGTQIENPGKIRLLKRTIAKIYTIMREKTEQGVNQ